MVLGASVHASIVPRVESVCKMAEPLGDYLKGKSISKSTENKLNIDIDVDKLTGELRVKVKDPYLGRAFIKKMITKLPVNQLYDIAEFALREGNHPGRLFVSVCEKTYRDANL